jgi:hypothetical protein
MVLPSRSLNSWSRIRYLTLVKPAAAQVASASICAVSRLKTETYRPGTRPMSTATNTAGGVAFSMAHFLG